MSDRGHSRETRGSNWWTRVVVTIVGLATCLWLGTTSAESANPTAPIWLSHDQISRLPTSGVAWQALAHAAHTTVRHPSLADQDDPANVNTLALALYAARTGDERAQQRVARVCKEIQGTERGARVLAVGRELAAYVIAADLVGLPATEDADFRNWLRHLQTQQFEGRSLRSTHEDRPNNWGTHAGASRIAVAAYLGDRQEIERAAHVFRGWLGEAGGWRSFEFGDTWWQPWGFRRFAVNPPGATLRGHSIDGVLPDDQRRGGPFRWPPPKENYVYEGLQGAVTQAMLLERQGYDVWQWGDRALLRAFRWLYEQADYPARGDDTWMLHVINRVYGTDFPAPADGRPGKGMGFTGWTHGGGAMGQ